MAMVVIFFLIFDYQQQRVEKRVDFERGHGGSSCGWLAVTATAAGDVPGWMDKGRM